MTRRSAETHAADRELAARYFVAYAQSAARPAGTTPSFGQLGPGGIVEYFVGMSDVHAHTAKLAHLNRDIIDFEIPPLPEPHTYDESIERFWQTRELVAYKWTWSLYWVRWHDWVDTHFSTFSRVGEDAVTEFEAFQAEYNELRRRFLADFAAHGSKTSAPRIDEVGPTGGETVEKVAGAVSAVAIAVIAVAGYLAIQSFERAGMLGGGR